MQLPEKLTDINQELDNEMLQKFPGLSVSDAAEWRSWTYIFSVAIRTLQLIVADFKTWIEGKLTFLRPGTIGWYAEIARQYQDGYGLVIKTDGSLGYEVSDIDAQIVAAVSVSESAEGILVFKVARDVEGVLGEFTQGQLLRFRNYLELVKFVGTKVSVISTAADVLKYDVVVYFDPAVQQSAIESRISIALESFASDQGFNGVIYKQKFAHLLMLVEGVVTVQLSGFMAKPSGGEFSPIDISYISASGYFNYSEDSTIVFMPATEIV